MVFLTSCVFICSICSNAAFSVLKSSTSFLCRFISLHIRFISSYNFLYSFTSIAASFPFKLDEGILLMLPPVLPNPKSLFCTVSIVCLTNLFLSLIHICRCRRAI
eukprot:TRINITY_DN8661_c0_g2_i1.p2 TRINITY_DN8661_c0_g2~~TRINITY_DN8661_c0_g2_i1.p2  ORF type:complete len:105 (-),score=7.49 TRINITY_DN8661_c0_g2_i1:52-366(-)